MLQHFKAGWPGFIAALLGLFLVVLVFLGIAPLDTRMILVLFLLAFLGIALS